MRRINWSTDRGETILKVKEWPVSTQLSHAPCGERWSPIPGKGFGLGGAVTVAPSPFDPPNSTGEFQWGGVAGTHWWISPQADTAGVLMAQRQMGFWNPFFFEFKRLAYEAAGAS